MGNSVIFYKDIVDTFECDIKIEGTSLSESKARLLFKFKNRSYIFEGTISSDGRVKVIIPKLSEVSDDSGHAVLEVIAESSYFEAWSSDFQLKNKKEVKINEVKISSSNKNVVIENISAEVHPEPTKKSNIYKGTCSEKNKKFIKETFDRFSSLPSSDKKKLKKQIKEFNASPLIKKWGESSFEDTNTLHAKLCMYVLQNGKSK
jgi:hypothetical protein